MIELNDLNDEKLENLINHQLKKNNFEKSTPIIPEAGFVIKSKIIEIKIQPEEQVDEQEKNLEKIVNGVEKAAYGMEKAAYGTEKAAYGSEKGVYGLEKKPEKKVLEKEKLLYDTAKSQQIVTNHQYGSDKDEYNWNVGMKIFCNLCHSPSIPAPPLVSKDEIVKAIKNDDASTYKVPLSLSKPRSDIAKDGSICIVFDACINSRPYNQSLEDEDFKFFLADLALAWIQEKYSISLSEKYSFPKMIAKGTLVPHMIKRPPRPVISEIGVKASVPSYTIVLEPEENPEYLVVQIHLPLLNSCADSELYLEAKRFIFKGLDLYELDIPLAFPIDVESAGATFDCATKYLHVTTTCIKDSN